MSVITIPRPLREKLGDDGVDALVAVINEANLSSRDNLAAKSDIVRVEHKIESTKSSLELKIESVKSDLELKIESVKSDLELKIESVKSDLELKIESVKSDLELKIEKSKSETLKWMFIFWAGQLLAVFAMFKAFIK